MTLIATVPRPGLLWEPAFAQAQPFVFNLTATTIDVGDILQWDADNHSGRVTALNSAVSITAGTQYTHAGRTLNSTDLFINFDMPATTGPVVEVLTLGSLTGIEVGDTFLIASKTDNSNLVLAGDGLGIGNNTVNDFTAIIRHDATVNATHPINFWRPSPVIAHANQDRMMWAVAQEACSVNAVASYDTNRPLPRCRIAASGFMQVNCDSAVVVGDFLTHSETAGRTASRKASTAQAPTLVLGRALEQPPSGGGLTWCLFDGFYGMGTTSEVYT